MMNLTCIEKDGKLICDEMQNAQMFTIDGEELTPLEVTQLAYYFALNWDWEVKQSIGSDGK